MKQNILVKETLLANIPRVCRNDHHRFPLLTVLIMFALFTLLTLFELFTLFKAFTLFIYIWLTLLQLLTRITQKFQSPFVVCFTVLLHFFSFQMSVQKNMEHQEKKFFPLQLHSKRNAYSRRGGEAFNVIPTTPPYLLKGRQRGKEGLRDSHHASCASSLLPEHYDERRILDEMGS